VQAYCTHFGDPAQYPKEEVEVYPSHRGFAAPPPGATLSAIAAGHTALVDLMEVLP